ncbi:hypothetical protein HDV00_005766 [Rhizophlyctis rosea]|nr:hypothetical protein HDV00_005766 [Rhizophlyctis rosea]
MADIEILSDPDDDIPIAPQKAPKRKAKAPAKTVEREQSPDEPPPQTHSDSEEERAPKRPRRRPPPRPQPNLNGPIDEDALFDLGGATKPATAPPRPVQPRRRSSKVNPTPRELRNLQRSLQKYASTFVVEDDPDIEMIENPKPTTTKPAASVPPPPPSEPVTIKVNFVVWPPDASDKPKSIKIKIQQSDCFQKIFEALANKLSVAQSDLVLTYKNAKIFSFATPAGCGITSTATIECHRSRAAFDAYCKHRDEQKRRDTKALLEEKDTVEEIQAVNEEDSGPSEDMYIAIKLQEKSGKVYKIKILKTSTIDKLIASYIKLRDEPLPTGANVRVFWDGEVLGNATVLSDTEIESGDVVEIRT